MQTSSGAQEGEQFAPRRSIFNYIKIEEGAQWKKKKATKLLFLNSPTACVPGQILIITVLVTDIIVVTVEQYISVLIA